MPTRDELKFVRTYPQGKLYSHVTGYYSFTYGAGGGVEGAEDGLLSGQSDKLFYRRVVDMVTGKVPGGASLELTINPAAQKAADEALGNQRGAVVALDPRTGAILAMVSHPQYDPATLASHDLDSVENAWKKLQRQPGPARWSTAPSPATSTPRARPSSWSRPRPRSPPASTPRTPSCPARPAWTCRRPRPTCPTTTACPAAPATSPP